MTLPESIAVRFTEEDAGYVTVRPIQRQIFRPAQLADMILSVTGKDAARLDQIFRAGSITYNGFRYSWQGFVAAPHELAALLAEFPDDDPARAFRAEEAGGVILEYGERVRPVELRRAETSARELFRSRSAWDWVTEFLARRTVSYARYSRAHRADLFRAKISAGEGAALLREMAAAAPRGLRRRLESLPAPAGLLVYCPRKEAGKDSGA